MSHDHRKDGTASRCQRAEGCCGRRGGIVGAVCWALAVVRCVERVVAVDILLGHPRDKEYTAHMYAPALALALSLRLVVVVVVVTTVDGLTPSGFGWGLSAKVEKARRSESHGGSWTKRWRGQESAAIGDATNKWNKCVCLVMGDGCCGSVD